MPKAKRKTFVAIAPYAWGKSTKSIDDAVRNAKKHVPRSLLTPGRYPISVYVVTGTFLGVDGLGRIEYKNGAVTRLESSHVVAVTRATGAPTRRVAPIIGTAKA